MQTYIYDFITVNAHHLMNLVNKCHKTVKQSETDRFLFLKSQQPYSEKIDKADTGKD